jgi:hypothetical protein
MFRAAAWTAGLFGVGASVVHFLPVGAWVEPLVLAALGGGLILAGGRGAAAARSAAGARSARGLEPAERAAR